MGLPNESLKVKTFVVIVTYNGLQWLAECLDSCRGYEVVIVDNASTDGSVNYLRNTFSQLHLLPQDKNLGFGQANNLGISYSLKQGADYVFLLNQDAYLHQGCLEVLISIHKQNQKYGILSPIHLTGKGNRLDQNFSNYVSFKKNPDFYSDFILKKPLQNVYKVPFVNAAGWLLSRDLLETVGGFDPIFFHYGEDDNYCQRVRYHNFKIGVVPKAFLNHDREDRIKVKGSTASYLINRERGLKSKYADINEDNIEELENLLRKTRRSFIKLFFNLKFSKLKIVREEMLIIEKVIKEVTDSRRLNKLKGRNYLD